MTDRFIDERTFWEGKILGWEHDRYGAGRARGALLERIAGRASGSLRFRLSFAGAHLARYAAGKRVVELGCGSGLLAPDLIKVGAVEYRGFDIADRAVERGRRRAEQAGLADRIAFARADVGALPRLDTDIVFSLGLFDWLGLDQIDRVFAAAGAADFLHSISERRASLAQWLHRLYVHLAYGRRSAGYVPRYYATAEIAAIARRHGHAEVHVYRDRRLSFGALVGSLPFS